VSTWEAPPEEAQHAAIAAPSRRGLYIADVALPPGTPGRTVDWSRHTESSTGNAFWLNTSTGDTVWAAISTPRPGGATANLNDSSWEQLYDPNSQRYFHVHVDTGAVEWGPVISEEHGGTDTAAAQRVTTLEASPSQLSGGIFRAAGAAAKWKRRARLATEKRRRQTKEAERRKLGGKVAIPIPGVGMPPRGLVRGMKGAGVGGAGESKGGDGDKGENATGDEGAVIDNSLAMEKVTVPQKQHGLGGKGGKGGKGRRGKMTVVRNFAAPAEGKSPSFGGHSCVAAAVAHWKRRAKLSSSISSAGPKFARLQWSGKENEEEEEEDEKGEGRKEEEGDEVALRSNSVEVLPIQTGHGLHRDSSNKCVTTMITRRMPAVWILPPPPGSLRSKSAGRTPRFTDEQIEQHWRRQQHQRQQQRPQNVFGDSDGDDDDKKNYEEDRGGGGQIGVSLRGRPQLSGGIFRAAGAAAKWKRRAQLATEKYRKGRPGAGVSGGSRDVRAKGTPLARTNRGSSRGEIAFVNPLRISWRNRRVNSSTINPLSARSKMAAIRDDATHAATNVGGGGAGGGGGDDWASPLLDPQVVKLEEKLLAHFEEMKRTWEEDG
jgi:hypothetical protein